MTAPTNLGPDWLLQQLAEMRKVVDSSGFRIGTIISYSGGNIAVQIGTPTSSSSAGQSSAASGTVLNAAYISKHGGYLPVAGDQVLIAKIGASWVVLGTFGNISGGDPYFDWINPVSTDGRAGHITAFNSGGNTTFEVSRINNATRQRDGAWIWLTSIISVGGTWGATGDLNSAVSPFNVATSAGFTGQILTYGPTMATAPAPDVAVSGATPNFDWCVTAATTTGCTVSWSDTNAHTTFAWCFR